MALQEFGTLSQATLPPGRKAIPCKWVFKIKRDEKGELIKYRARLVATGFKQIAGKDFSEVFAPGSKHATFRMLLSNVASQDLALHHIDIKTAFMNGELLEEIYMQPPPGWDSSLHVWKLHKGVNGLKQAARAWNQKLKETVKQLGYRPSNSDVSLFSKGTASNANYMLWYVDDILLAGDLPTITRIKQAIARHFKCDDLGDANLFLGMKIIRNRSQRTLWLGQPHYALEIIERAGLSDFGSRCTPLDPNLQISKDLRERSPEILTRYQELVGCLLYLTGCTRRDIAHAVGFLSRFMSAPTDVQLNAGKQVLRYLVGTVHLGIQYSKGAYVVTGYCDADYAADLDKRKSTSGYVFMLIGAAISWASKLQP